MKCFDCGLQFKQLIRIVREIEEEVGGEDSYGFNEICFKCSFRRALNQV